MPSSRKRNKGKERKAKALVAQEEREADVRRKWLSWASPKNVQCRHSLQTIPAEDHIVSKLMNLLWEPWPAEGERRTNSVMESFTPATLGNLEKFFSNMPMIWEDDNVRQTAINVLLSIGVNILLYRLDHPILVEMAAAQIALLQNYDGKGDYKSVMFAAAQVIRDVSGGGERHATRFFAKPIACSCLKAKNSQVKKEQPKTGMCDGCLHITRRDALMVCSRCKLVQFCSRACQVEYWPKHKQMCDNAVQHMKSKRYIPGYYPVPSSFST